MRYKRYMCLILIIITIIFTGCSTKDAVEITSKENVLAVGVDITEESSDYLVTAEVGIESTGINNKRLLTSRYSDNLISFDKKNTWIGSLIHSDDLTRVVVLGNDILQNRDNLSKFVEDIKESSQVNKKTLLIIADEKACDIVDNENNKSILTGDNIYESLSALTKQSFEMTYDLSSVISGVQSYGGILIPVVSSKSNRLSIDKVAIVKDYRLLGYLDYEENSILSMLTTGSATCLQDIKLEIDFLPIKLICDNVNVTQDVKLVDKNLSIDYLVTINCRLNLYNTPIKYKSEQEYLNIVCDEADKKMTTQTNELIRKLQKTYNVDMLKIQDDLIRYNKVEYEKIAREYNSTFRDASITVKYNINIDNSSNDM